MQYRHKKKMPVLTILISLLIYISSIQVTSNLLLHPLEYKFLPPSKIDGDVIVMLGGGATLDTPDFSGKANLSGHAANRLLTAARIYNKTKLPIIVSGGKVFENTGTEAEIAKRQLLDLGVAEKDIIVENRSLNTTENAINTKKLMSENNLSKPILITSAFHMERSMMNFNNAGIKDIVAYPCDYSTNTRLDLSINTFVPNYDSLNAVGISLKEYLGIFQLWIKKIV
jgi:uncharacterized SAM-binding protein YcdF (DUF218 family)